MKNSKKIKRLVFLMTVFVPHFFSMAQAQPAKQVEKVKIYRTSSEPHELALVEGKKEHAQSYKKRKKGSRKTSSSEKATPSTSDISDSEPKKVSDRVIILPRNQVIKTRERSGSDPISPRPQTFTFTIVINSSDALPTAPFQITVPLSATEKPYQEEKNKASTSMPTHINHAQVVQMPEIKPLDFSRILAERERAFEKEQKKSLRPNARPRPVSADSLQNMFLKGIVDSLDRIVINNALIIFDEELEKKDFEGIALRIQSSNIISLLENAENHLTSHPTFLAEMLDRKDTEHFQKKVQRLIKNAQKLGQKLKEDADNESMKRSLERANKYAIALLKMLKTRLQLETAIKSKVLDLYAQLSEEQPILFEEASA